MTVLYKHSHLDDAEFAKYCIQDEETRDRFERLIEAASI